MIRNWYASVTLCLDDHVYRTYRRHHSDTEGIGKHSFRRLSLTLCSTTLYLISSARSLRTCNLIYLISCSYLIQLCGDRSPFINYLVDTHTHTQTHTHTNTYTDFHTHLTVTELTVCDILLSCVCLLFCLFYVRL